MEQTALEYSICVDLDPMWRKTKDSNEFGVGGSLIDLAHFIAKEAKFNFTLQNIIDSWVREMIVEDCDIALGLFALYPQLAQHLDYSSPITSAKVVILSRSPKEEPSTTGIDINYQVLTVLVITINIMAVLTSAAENIARKMRNSVSYGKEEALGLWKCFWMYYSSIFIEPFPLSLMTEASKILAASWLIFLMIMLSFIGGTMKAERTLSRDLTINELDDILKYPKVSTIIAQESPVENYFRNSKYPAAIAVNNKIKRQKSATRYNYVKRKIPEVIAGESVIIQDELFFLPLLHEYYKNISTGGGQLHLSDKEIFLIHCPIFFSKQSGIPQGILEIASQKVTYFAATLQMAPHTRYLRRGVERFLERQRPEMKMNVGFLFYLWLAATSFCVGFLLVEIGYHKWQTILNPHKV